MAAIATILPDGWTAKDAESKLFNIMNDSFRKIKFAEKAPKTGAKAKRLKFQPKAFTASYSTSMIGSTKDVGVRPIDLYNWLWDISEIQTEWSNKEFPAIIQVNIPASLRDWLDTVFKSKEVVSEDAEEAEVEDEEEAEEVNA